MNYINDTYPYKCILKNESFASGKYLCKYPFSDIDFFVANILNIELDISIFDYLENNMIDCVISIDNNIVIHMKNEEDLVKFKLSVEL